VAAHVQGQGDAVASVARRETGGDFRAVAGSCGFHGAVGGTLQQ